MSALAPSLTSEAYRGAADLPALLAFAARFMAERWPMESIWHPGDIVWQLKPDYDAAKPIRLWSEGGAPLAMSMFTAADEFWIDSRSEDVAAAVIAKAEGLAAKAGAQRLAVRAWESDAARAATLARLGYAWGEGGPIFRFDLSGDLPPVRLESGFTARDSVGLDPEARAKCHRDAWDHLEHLGIEGRSSFSTEVYRALAAAPLYDPALDIVIAAPDGELVANALAWADPVSGVGNFEPVGASGAYRGRGFGRAAVVEGLHRLKAAGMRWARVGTAHFNAPAIATYLSSGFEITDRGALWTKALAA